MHFNINNYPMSLLHHLLLFGMTNMQIISLWGRKCITSVIRAAVITCCSNISGTNSTLLLSDLMHPPQKVKWSWTTDLDYPGLTAKRAKCRTAAEKSRGQRSGELWQSHSLKQSHNSLSRTHQLKVSSAVDHCLKPSEYKCDTITSACYICVSHLSLLSSISNICSL